MYCKEVKQKMEKQETDGVYTNRCCVKGCQGKQEGWIDVIDDYKKNKEDRVFGKMWFCQKHFDIVYPFIKEKEKQDIGKETTLKDGTKVTSAGWLFAPLSLVNEALSK